jgi:hypothetical protein
MISRTQSNLLIRIFGVYWSGALLIAATQYDPAAAEMQRQLRIQYTPTKVGANGVVLVGGSVVVVQQDGIKANPAFGDIYWPNSYKKGGRVKRPAIFIKNGVSKVVNDVRFLQVGEKVYVTNIEIKDADVVFSLQTCGGGPDGNDPNGAPYRSTLSFQFQKGHVNPANLKQIQDSIGEVLAIAPPGSDSNRNTTGLTQGTQPLLTLGPVYVNSQNSADQLQLNTNGSFSLQEGGQSFNGTYSVAGTALRLHIVQLQKDVDIAIQGNRLIVNGEETWVQPSQ